MKTDMKIEKFNICDSTVDVCVSFSTQELLRCARVSIVFECDSANRRLPMRVKKYEDKVVAYGKYDCAYVFYKLNPKSVKFAFVFSDGREGNKYFPTDFSVDNIKKSRIKHLLGMSSKEFGKHMIGGLLNAMALPFRALRVKSNRVLFLTNRTKLPTGNLKAIYNQVKDMPDLDVKLLCSNGGAKGNIPVLFRFFRLYMTSKVVFVDDYYHLISFVNKKADTKLIQLWHGCGAFKTFGFSRYHKASQLQIDSANHRQYDYAIVSSESVRSVYAEAFGISKEKVLALGSPRCDVLIDEAHKNSVVAKFYKKYPELKDKKILLFAPTFRGKGNGNCYYPVENFNVDKVLDILGDEWAVVIKLHPYLTEKFSCSGENKNRMADCSSSDINDILYVTDFLVTDYSSVIYEASILDIPMAFLAFDLEEFIAKRDFYFDFKAFVPGPIVKTDDELAELVKSGGGDLHAVKVFRENAFGNSLGNACSNVIDLMNKILNEE